MQGRFRTAALAAALGVFVLVGGSQAQTPPAPATPPPPQPLQFPSMTFFITSKSGPDGANFGGLEGADRHCQTLAAAAGAGSKTWRAYLSQQAVGGKPAVNARDRIGKGPWHNVRGIQIAANVDELHSRNNINTENGRAETGRMIPSRLFVVNQHDILTGSLADGTAPPPDKDLTCGNWTKNGEGSAMVGHHDRMSIRDDEIGWSWNSTHPSRGCSAASLIATGGAGLLYCFAAN
jgi:hypothetical protein